MSSPSSVPVVTYTTLIDAPALSARIVADSASLVIIDCRADLSDHEAGARAFAERHLPGARHLNLETDLSGPKAPESGRHPLPVPDELAAKLSALGVGPTTQVVAYDAHGGMYAARLWWLLRWIGHAAVAVLDGGMQAWEAQGGLMEFSVPRTIAEGGLSVRPSLASTVDTAAILDHLSTQGAPLIVDARAPDRYRGENEDRDPVAGHIPGARNRFFKDNLAADGTFQSPQALRAAFAEVLEGTSPANVVMQCGSGVTACHNLLALEIAGMPGAALYPGSWSAWVSSTDRPVNTGPNP